MSNLDTPSSLSSAFGKPQPYLPPSALPPQADRSRRGPPPTYPSIKYHFNPGDSLTPDQSDIPCRLLGEHLLRLSLLALVGLELPLQNTAPGWSYTRWTISDTQWFLDADLDFGTAYSIARIAWAHFKSPATGLQLVMGGFDVAGHRQRLWAVLASLEQERENAIAVDPHTHEEVINEPTGIMPRRIWDLKANRLVDFRVLTAEHMLLRERSPEAVFAYASRRTYPVFWAVTHSWTADMVKEESPTNGYQWPIPLPSGVTLDQVRSEILSFGGEYVWLDVVCLRQEAGPEVESVRAQEWKIDVPTIGNIYCAAFKIVRYFNGLGRAFSRVGWSNERHWINRAWTLQEVRPEAITHTGGVLPGVVFMNETSEVDPGRILSFRQVFAPVLRFAKLKDGTGMRSAPLEGAGCSLYDLAREMQRRHSSNPVDKVAGLLYLLRRRTPQLPVYALNITAEVAWERWFHHLSFELMLEIAFDFPHRGGEWQMFPTWNQLLNWPTRDPDMPHQTPEWTSGENLYIMPTTLMAAGLEMADLAQAKPFYYPKGLLLCDVLLEPHSDSEGSGREYWVTRGASKIAFVRCYPDQPPIPRGNYTLAGHQISEECNWIVGRYLGELIGDQFQDAQTSLPRNNGQVRAAILKKVGVLKTDFVSDLGSVDFPIVERHCMFI